MWMLALLVACQPGQGVLSGTLSQDSGTRPLDTAADTDTDTDTDSDADTDTDTDTDVDSTATADTATVPTGPAPPCGDGQCTWALVLEESLPQGRPRGAIGAAVDASGVVHVVVHDPSESRLLYLRSNTPDVEAIGDGAGEAESTEISVAVDVDGRVHVATMGGDGYRLIAREPGGDWNQQPVGPRGDVVTTAAVSRGGDTWVGAGSDLFVWNGGGYTPKPSAGDPVEALALDLAGTTHALVGTGGPEPIYTRFDGSAWVARVPIYAGVFQRTRLQIGDDDVGHAVVEVENPPGSDLLYAETSTGGWQVTSLAVGGSAHASGVALDASDRPHVSYHDGVGAVFHGWFDGSGWVRSEVGGAGAVQETIPLVDPLTDQPVVVYYDTSTDTLRIYRGS